MNLFNCVKVSLFKPKTPGSQEVTLDPFKYSALEKVNAGIINKLVNGEHLFNCSCNPTALKTHLLLSTHREVHSEMYRLKETIDEIMKLEDGGRLDFGLESVYCHFERRGNELNVSMDITPPEQARLVGVLAKNGALSEPTAFELLKSGKITNRSAFLFLEQYITTKEHAMELAQQVNLSEFVDGIERLHNVSDDELSRLMMRAPGAEEKFNAQAAPRNSVLKMLSDMDSLLELAECFSKRNASAPFFSRLSTEPDEVLMNIEDIVRFGQDGMVKTYDDAKKVVELMEKHLSKNNAAGFRRTNGADYNSYDLMLNRAIEFFHIAGDVALKQKAETIRWKWLNQNERNSTGSPSLN